MLLLVASAAVPFLERLTPGFYSKRRMPVLLAIRMVMAGCAAVSMACRCCAAWKLCRCAWPAQPAVEVVTCSSLPPWLQVATAIPEEPAQGPLSFIWIWAVSRCEQQGLHAGNGTPRPLG